MINPMISLCGFRCDLCLAYKPHIENNPQNRQILSDGWHTYFGFRLSPDEICCEGCSAETNETLDRHCPVRPCVIERGLSNCASCEDYIYDTLTQRLVRFDAIQADFEQPIPAPDRRLLSYLMKILFGLKPYEVKKTHLLERENHNENV